MQLPAHSSQVDLNGTFAKGQAYVGASRSTELDGLELVPGYDPHCAQRCPGGCLPSALWSETSSLKWRRSLRGARE